MEKLWNGISVIIGILGGIGVKLFGGFDKLLATIIVLVVLDYITGILKAVMTKTLSSEIGFKGIIKKIIVFIVIAVSVCIQGLIGDNIPLREITIMFFVCNEALSLLENAAMFVPIPDKLKDVLLQLRDKKEE